MNVCIVCICSISSGRCFSAINQGTATMPKATTTAATGPLPNHARTIQKNVQVPGLKNGMDYVQLGDSDLIVSKVCSKSKMF